MDILRHRPLFTGCLVFIAATTLGFVLPLAGLLILGGAILLGAIGYGVYSVSRGLLSRRSMTLPLAALLVCLALGRSFLAFNGPSDTFLREKEGTTVTANGVITDRLASGGNLTAYRLTLSSVDGRALGETVYLTCHYVADLQPGDRVNLTATLVSLEEAAGNGDRALSLTGDGYTAGLLSEEEAQVTVTGTHRGWIIRVGQMRRTLSARLELSTGRSAEGLPSALLLGDTSYLEHSLRRDFSRAGVSHMLAISGLHVSMLFGILGLLLKTLRVPKRLRGILSGLCAVGYLVLLGFPASATRAVIMLGMVYLSSMLFLRADPLTSLGLAGVLLLWFDPCSVADAGFWMSMLATLGIVTLLPLFRLMGGGERRGFCKALLGRVGLGLAVGVIAVSFTLLVTATVMGELSLLSPLSTVLLTPLCGVALILSLVTLLTVATPVGALCGTLTGGICSLMAKATHWLGQPTYAVISLRHPAMGVIAFLMVAATLTLLVLRLPRRRRGLILLPLVLGWLLMGGVWGTDALLTRQATELSYIQPSSQSEAIVLVQGQRGFVCDLSNGSLSALSSAVREAEEQGATEITALMLTHYHSRTPGALSTLLGRETVRELWLPAPTDGTEYYLLASCLEKAEEAGVTVCLYERGEELRIFGTGAVALETAMLERSVQPVLLVSLSLRGEEGKGHDLLYCGSAVFESELAETASRLASEADMLIFGGHGPLCKAPFGGEIRPEQAETVVLSDNGDMAAWFSADALPTDTTLWLGAYRSTLRP